MLATLAYNFRSAVVPSGDGQTLAFAPNLAREPVAFDAQLLKPVRFREAISALHDVVISDLRFKKKDKTAYLEWKKRRTQQEDALRKGEHKRLVEQARQKHEIPEGFESEYDRLRKRYWSARQQYADYLYKHDRELWRMLMPCDPVVTVADDVVFFECFSADESSYGCLTAEREGAFGASHSLKF